MSKIKQSSRELFAKFNWTGWDVCFVNVGQCSKQLYIAWNTPIYRTRYTSYVRGIPRTGTIELCLAYVRFESIILGVLRSTRISRLWVVACRVTANITIATQLYFYDVGPKAATSSGAKYVQVLCRLLRDHDHDLIKQTCPTSVNFTTWHFEIKFLDASTTSSRWWSVA